MILILLINLFTLVQLNCENLFDTKHDAGKHDEEFLPESYHHWTTYKYWHKLNNIGREIIACGGKGEQWQIPDIVALCEVENDSVLFDLTYRSLLRTARYEYVMTASPDERGIDVALLYSPFSFKLVDSYPIRINPLKGMRPTRDILYVKGCISTNDTLHIMVVHSPSRFGGEKQTRPNRMLVAKRLVCTIDSIRQLNHNAKIIVSGDFNDYGKAPALKYIEDNGLIDISKEAKGKNGAKGSYRYKGEWGSLDHIFISRCLEDKVTGCYIFDAPFLLEEEKMYGGVKPFRTFWGAKYLGGYSDHLPIIAHFSLSVQQ